MASPQLVNGVLIEQVGHDAVVVIPGRLEAIRLTGEPAAMLLSIQSGQPANFSKDTVDQLVELGIIDIPGLSRRRLINAGMVGAGAGIAALALPSVAAASSGSGGGGGSGTFPVLFQLTGKSFARTATSPNVWTFTFGGPPNVFNNNAPPTLRFDGFAFPAQGFTVDSMSQNGSEAVFPLGTGQASSRQISSELDTFLSNIAVGNTIPDGTVRILSEGVLYVVVGVVRAANVA